MLYTDQKVIRFMRIKSVHSHYQASYSVLHVHNLNVILIWLILINQMSDLFHVVCYPAHSLNV